MESFSIHQHNISTSLHVRPLNTGTRYLRNIIRKIDLIIQHGLAILDFGGIDIQISERAFPI
jgi:hypothetical protein